MMSDSPNFPDRKEGIHEVPFSIRTVIQCWTFSTECSACLLYTSKSDPVVSVQILFRNLYRVNQIHLICRRDCVQQLLRIPMMSGCVHNLSLIHILKKKNVPWHILAPRRGCFGNHLPLRRVRILSGAFLSYGNEVSYTMKKSSRTGKDVYKRQGCW